MPFLVESPRWLANHKGIDEATAVISRLRGKPIDHPEVLEVRREIQLVLEEDKSSGGWYDLFKSTGEQNLRRLMLGVVGLYMQQIGGIKYVLSLPFFTFLKTVFPPFTAVLTDKN